MSDRSSVTVPLRDESVEETRLREYFQDQAKKPSAEVLEQEIRQLLGK